MSARVVARLEKLDPAVGRSWTVRSTQVRTVFSA